MTWPAPGLSDMQGGMERVRMPIGALNHFTATCGPDIFRGDRLPADLRGDLLFAEPVGRMIRRAKVVVTEGLTQLRNAYPELGVHPEHRSALPAGEHDDRARRHALHRRHVSRHHSGVGVDAARVVPPEEDRAAPARQDHEPRPDLAARVRRHRAEPTAAAHARRAPGPARRPSRASERLVARHGAEAARPASGPVGRAGAPAR